MGHSKGPWRVVFWSKIASSDEKVVAECYKDSSGSVLQRPRTDEENHANCSLIAAAPDLLELANHILAMDGDPYLLGHLEWSEIMEEARTIVEKMS